MKKKLIIIAAAIIVVLGGAVGIFALKYKKMVRVITSEYANVVDVDLNTVNDGEYTGSFGEFLVSVDLKATVQNHQIIDLTIVKQDCGKGYEARETIDRIMKSQSVRVDAVSGATGSSRCIMIATYKALIQKP